jgi:uncharacterized membrane protein (DUF4010 family)
MKSVIIRIMGWAGVALIVPVLGNTYVEGWNWDWHDFLFAWVFWVVMGTSIYLIARKYGRYRWLVGTLVFFCFAAVWAILATG